MAATDRDDEAPLDPAAERLRRKLVRLLFVSGGIMALGLIAVFAAIVYKVDGSGLEREAEAAARSAPPIEAHIAIPAGARLVSTELQGDRALLHLEAPGAASSLIVIDIGSGRVLGRFSLQPE